MQSELLLTPNEASERLRVPKSWLYGKVHKGDLPFAYVKIGHYLRFPAAELEAYIRQSTHAGRAGYPLDGHWPSGTETKGQTVSDRKE